MRHAPLAEDLANQLAAELGDLPLAAAQAAAVTIQVVAGIQTVPLVSSVRTSNGRRPCLAAVDR
jgi:hypothetical protein